MNRHLTNSDDIRGTVLFIMKLGLSTLDRRYPIQLRVSGQSEIDCMSDDSGLFHCLVYIKTNFFFLYFNETILHM